LITTVCNTVSEQGRGSRYLNITGISVSKKKGKMLPKKVK